MNPEVIKFRVDGLFDEFNHVLDFGKCSIPVGQARVAIIVGPNGIGKTTILNMIAGMLELEFSIFRTVPFVSAALTLSTGVVLSVVYDKARQCLHVAFDGYTAELGLEQSGAATRSGNAAVQEFKDAANPTLKLVSFEKVDIHRSVSQRPSDTDLSLEWAQRAYLASLQHRGGKLEREQIEQLTLSSKVRRFVREAQLDYRKYFSSDGPEIFPRILRRLQNASVNSSTSLELIDRLHTLKIREPEMARFGLSMNIGDIDQLSEILQVNAHGANTLAALATLEAYVETLEGKHEERELIAERLSNFERVTKRFFVGKKILIDYEDGLKIVTSSGRIISEQKLSSGEYHLLYMLVTALVSTRSGTTIAIDEPELSLHVIWQRQLIHALVDCSAGASPLFVFATHSISIASEFQDSWIALSEKEV